MAVPRSSDLLEYRPPTQISIAGSVAPGVDRCRVRHVDLYRPPPHPHRLEFLEPQPSVCLLAAIVHRDTGATMGPRADDHPAEHPTSPNDHRDFPGSIEW
jgi:hypothetical protein